MTYAVENVSGNPFPVDMLRYDSAHPEKEGDAMKIEASVMHQQSPVGEYVYLVSTSAPTPARWESFGWVVK